MKRAFLPLILFLLSVFIGFVFVTTNHIIQTKKETGMSVKQMRTFAETYGSIALREHVVAVSMQLNYAEAHDVGHRLGQVLFEREGVHAVTICENLFTYGCLHQVMGQLYLSEGESALSKVYAECRTEDAAIPYGVCQHALGHGIVYMNGYDTAVLEKSLLLCDSMTDSNRVLDYDYSCYGGLFMEYNMHFMRMSDPRPYDGERPFTPCEELNTTQHRNFCAFWLVPWMHGQVYQYQYDPNTYTEMGDFCSFMHDHDMQNACFHAIGRQIAITGRLSAKTAIQRCEAAAKTTDDYKACTLEAVRMFRWHRQDFYIPTLCNTLADQGRAECFAYAAGADVVAEQ